jgi:hypothetical protein
LGGIAAVSLKPGAQIRNAVDGAPGDFHMLVW